MDVHSTNEIKPDNGQRPKIELQEILARPLFVSLCLALITLAVFAPVRQNKFVSFDDAVYVTGNTHIAGGLTLKGIGWAFTTGYAANWHPLTWISHMLDVTLFSTGEAGPHIVNLLLHIAATIVLFLALRRMTAAHWRSALVAALFALHPLHVESVAWVAERKDVLSTFFWMLTLWYYARHVREKRQAGSILTSRCLLFALVAFALGLMSKPMLVTVPFLLLLLDYWPLKRFSFEDWRHELPGLFREKIPFFVLSLAVSVVTYLVQQKGGAMNSVAEYPLSERVANFFVAYSEYVIKTIWPFRLAVYYPHERYWPAAQLISSVLLVGGLSALAIWFGRRWKFLFTGWFWFFGTLIPVSGLVQVGNQGWADRYGYVPLIGLFIIVIWGAGAVAIRRRVPSVVACTCSIIVVGLCAMRTRDQLNYWRDSEALYRRALAVTKDNVVAYLGLGIALTESGKSDEAIENLQCALRLMPEDTDILWNLGNAWAKKKQYGEAVYCFKAAIKIKPRNVDAHCALGDALIELKDFAAAREEFNEALRIDPKNVSAWCGLGNLAVDEGKKDEAMTCYQKALGFAETDPVAHNGLANLYSDAGQFNEAVREYELALRFKPHFPEAENNLGTALLRLGRMEEAIGHFRSVIEYQPSHVGAHVNLASALVAQGDLSGGVNEYVDALRLNPNLLEAHFNLAIVLLKLGKREDAAIHLREALRIRPGLTSAQQLLEQISSTTTTQ